MKQLLLQLQKHQFIQVFLTILLLGNRKIFFFLLGPLLGHFYSLRVSLTDVASTGLFMVHSKSTSTTNSNASKSHASKISSSKSSYPARRPCLLWDILDNTVEVMIISTFDKTNPFEEDYMLPNMSQETLQKKILLLKPTNESNQIFANLTSIQDGSYLVLKPIALSLEQEWKCTSIGPLTKEQMIYINNKLESIALDEFAERRKRFHQSDALSNSSIPQARCFFNCPTDYFEIDLDIPEWLDKSKKIFLNKILICFCI